MSTAPTNITSAARCATFTIGDIHTDSRIAVLTAQLFIHSK